MFLTKKLVFWLISQREREIFFGKKFLGNLKNNVFNPTLYVCANVIPPQKKYLDIAYMTPVVHVRYHGFLIPNINLKVPDNTTLMVPYCCGFVHTEHVREQLALA